MTWDDMRARSDEYHLWLEKKIKATDEKYCQNSAQNPGAPIRHPNGATFAETDRDYCWSDAIWCGDISIGDWPVEFFFDPLKTPNYEQEVQAFYDLCQTNNDFQQWLIDMFDNAFKHVMPVELHHVLEG